MKADTSPFSSDYINPIDLCNRLNAYIIPEAAVHAFLTFLFVINGYWLAIVLNLPLVLFNAKKYVGSYLSRKFLKHTANPQTGFTRTSTFWMRPRFSAS
jgi:hypothetical protein